MGDYEDRNGAQVHRLANIAGALEIAPGSRIDAFVTITGRVRIGHHVHISTGVCLFGGNGIEVGDYAAVSAGVKVFTSTEDLSGDWLTNPTVPRELRQVVCAAIRIGRHSVIGAGSVLLPGTDVGDGSCVGALSLVKTKLAPWGIYAGIPVRLIKERRDAVLALEVQ